MQRLVVFLVSILNWMSSFDTQLRDRPTLSLYAERDGLPVADCEFCLAPIYVGDEVRVIPGDGSKVICMTGDYCNHDNLPADGVMLADRTVLKYDGTREPAAAYIRPELALAQ